MSLGDPTLSKTRFPHYLELVRSGRKLKLSFRPTIATASETRLMIMAPALNRLVTPVFLAVPATPLSSSQR
ncbi:hypothetical protein AUG19_05220 [archaeon 13_1_20CM_2_54_9]|nr:MAG: hypothetical protein AUG19_05220 [archaeon 13_1_20CM_2_54_9]